MLPAFVLLVSLAPVQFMRDIEPAAAHFMWNIVGIYEPNMVVTIRPPRGLASVKAIALDPLPTRKAPNPRAILPQKTEPTPDGAGVRAWFGAFRKGFHLNVTLTDGSTHKIDIYARPLNSEPKNEPKPYRYYPEIAPRLSRT